ncbi:hepatic and glial cell adhesion molecule-like isoform 3-T3 [Macrochelys suwanniensis]
MQCALKMSSVSGYSSAVQLLVCFLTVLIWVHEIPAVNDTHVTEPLSQPELQSNSSLVGSTTEFVCKVPVGKVDSYPWKKDGKRLPEDSRFLLFQNDSILCILNTALSDNGVYTCEVGNQVSWNETSLKLVIQNPSNVVVGVVVVIGIVVVLVAVSYVSRKHLKCPTQCYCGHSDVLPWKTVYLKSTTFQKMSLKCLLLL